MKTLITAAIAAFAIGGGYLAYAQQSPPHHAAIATTVDAKQTPSMEGCMQMMADRQKSMDHMKDMDSKLEGLVAAMDLASPTEKGNATSAVVKELVSQRIMMRPMMGHMDSNMKSHMMMHMKAGKMECPMMKGMAGN